MVEMYAILKAFSRNSMADERKFWNFDFVINFDPGRSWWWGFRYCVAQLK